MTEFPIRQTMRVTNLRRPLTTSKGVKDRNRAVITMLGERGPLRAAVIASELGYKTSTSCSTMLTNMIKAGLIARTGWYYHLKGQTVAPGSSYTPYVKNNTATKDFFEGTSLNANLRRYLRDHQDEPLYISHIAKDVGYAGAPACGAIIHRMLRGGVLRRYQAPEDNSLQWRYQYVDSEKSGVTVTNPGAQPEQNDEPVQTATDTADAPLVDEHPAFTEELKQEVERIIEGEVAQAAHLIEKYAREFYWLTGSQNVKELVIWMKERALSAREK